MALFYHPPPLFLPPPTPATGHLLPSAVLATLPLPLSSPVDPSESPIDLSESSPIDETYLWLSPPFSPRWTREDDEALENAIAFNGALDSEAIAAAGSTRDDDKALENVIPVNGALDSAAIAPAAWTRDDDKALESAIAFNGAPDSEAIAGAVPGKTADEVRRHYGILVEDLDAIEAGRVPIPKYALDGGWSSDGGFGTPRPKSERVRRKGTPWSEQEHRDFLLGLKMCAKSNWRSLSRHYVILRTPTMVASHAQKYFIRQSCTKKDRRRTSIHDITTASIHDITSAKHPFSPSSRQ